MNEGDAIRVLVVDDSAFMRYVVSKELASDPAIQVVGTARDGIDALEKVGQLNPDVVTLDLEMPRMNGLEALDRIMSQCPLPVILLSSLTREGAEVTIRGLELGAADFVQKPSAVHAASSSATWLQLQGKIKDASRVDAGRLRTRSMQNRARLACRTHLEAPRSPAGPVVSVPSSHSRATRMERVVVIGTSTGGPRALFDVVPRLPADFPAAVLIVQHMPPGFTRSLAGRLNDVSALEVREAVDGDAIEAGVALIAPGDFHMAVRRGGKVGLERTPPLHGVRPAVDVTMESAASVYGAITVGVILTGMGRDGTSGALSVRRAGGYVVSEDEATCVVYGMPRSVWEAGAANRVARLEAVADAIVEAIAAPSVARGPRR